MGKLLVQVHSGAENPNKATLGCLVAATAAEQGHEVSLFFVANGVDLLAHSKIRAVNGNGTGNVHENLERLVAAGGKIFASQISAEVRLHDDDLFRQFSGTFASPEDLVRLTFEADRALSY